MSWATSPYHKDQWLIMYSQLKPAVVVLSGCTALHAISEEPDCHLQDVQCLPPRPVCCA